MPRNKHVHTEKSMPQKSEKWLKFRSFGVGASEISVLIGTFPRFWLSDFELFLRKMGKSNDFVNEAMEIGNRNEEKARKLLTIYLKNCKNNDENQPFCSNVYDRTGKIRGNNHNFKQYTVQHKEFPHIFSSYDGLDIRNKLVVEIKCPSQQVFTKLLKNRKPTIPKMYVPQVQTQLKIANSHWGITEGLFAIYYEDGVYFEDKLTKKTNLVKLILIETKIDLDYCKELEELCNKYFKMIIKREWNANWKD